MFSSIRCFLRILLERAMTAALEYWSSIVRSSETWDSSSALRASHRIFISWEPPHPHFFTISFDGSLRDSWGGAAFVIRDYHLGFLAAGGMPLLDSSVPAMELYVAWTGIRYARQILHLDRLFIEGDSVTVVSWIR